MSDTRLITYRADAAVDAIEIAATGQVVERGQTIEVPADLAGRPPTKAQGTEGEEGYVPADAGDGLLAQVANFEPATEPDADEPAKPAKTRKERG